MNRPITRPGFTLIEMLAIMGCTSILLTLCAVTIHGLFQAEKSARRDWAETAAIERLATRFRHDVHAATAEPEVSTPEALALTLGDAETVTYRIHNHEVIVTRKGANDVATQLETFPFRRWLPARLDRVDVLGRTLVRVVFRPAERPGDVEMAIEAVASLSSEGGKTP